MNLDKSKPQGAVKSFPKLTITVKIDGQPISINIDRADEEHIRRAAGEVNRIYSRYLERYGGDTTSRQDLLTYTALHFATVVEDRRKREEELALRQRLEALKNRLDEALYPHTDLE